LLESNQTGVQKVLHKQTGVQKVLHKQYESSSYRLSLQVSLRTDSKT
jgi:hypothetical protein